VLREKILLDQARWRSWFVLIVRVTKKEPYVLAISKNETVF
jgi:hypothetical protein